jgi:hypothetical protein
MKNVFKLIGTIALVAVIGFSMAACDDAAGGGGGGGGGGSGSSGKYNGHNLKSGSPPAATLSKYGISSAVMDRAFERARAAAVDPDYKGYYDDVIYNEGGITMSMLCYIWYNKTRAKYESVCNALANDLDWTVTDFDPGMYDGTNIPPGTVLTTGGAYDDSTSSSSTGYSMKTCTVMYYLKEYKDGKGGTVPKDTLVVGFMNVKMSF